LQAEKLVNSFPPVLPGLFKGNEFKKKGMKMKSSVFKGKIIANTEKRKQERKIAILKRFNEIKPKNRVFPSMNVNMEKFVFLQKIYTIKNPSKSALAVYPVLCSLADFKKRNWFYASQEDLSKMAGISETQVRKAISELIGLNLLNRKKITEGKVNYYKYDVTFIRGEMMDEMKEDAFIFHTCIVDSGVWSKLSYRAKAFYLALRSTAKFEFTDYCELELGINGGHELEEEIRGEWYRNRKWDVCRSPIINLCRLVNISHQNISPVIEQLEEVVLVKRYANTFMVYLKPSFIGNAYPDQNPY
jgi:DNA-binding Lrp family transcriptional regulator